MRKNDHLDFVSPECQIMGMEARGIHVTKLPELKAPLLIAGFDGWGNALGISKGMAAYLIAKFKAQAFADINPDVFYHYDVNRPEVDIVAGTLKRLTPPGGSFYAARNDSGTVDLVILEAGEPSLQWYRFADELFSLCRKLGVETVITLGSMYDNVVHTDRIISGIASNPEVFSRLKQQNIVPVSYQGPSAIHSTIQSEGVKRGFECISLWCHCPYYLQNTTHFGLLSHLGAVLSSLGNFELDTQDLDARWKALEDQIKTLIENSPELQSVVNELRKAKVRGTWESVKAAAKGEKVINLQDFLPPR
ncbi:MAG: PAC2 family protein [Proteobacteria bacterium]|nr:PAC2 family protein [Pseudomonadota bacterium]